MRRNQRAATGLGTDLPDLAHLAVVMLSSTASTPSLSKVCQDGDARKSLGHLAPICSKAFSEQHARVARGYVQEASILI